MPTVRATACSTTITAPSGVSGANRSFTYTTDQLLDIETHPETGAINHDYSAGGDRIRTAKAGLSVEFDFDGPGRLYYVDAPTGTNDVEFVYDQASLPTTIDNTTADYVQIWDGAQRLTRRTATIDGRTFVTNFDYDDHDRLTEIIYPSGRTFVHGYDGDGRVDSITYPGEGAYAPSITYTSHGGLDVLSYGNGAFSDLTYDSRFRPTLFNTQLDDLSVGYDPASRINSWSASGVTRGFGYDDLGRLTSATGPAGEAMSFIYNGAGNRSSSIVGGVPETYTYNSATGRLSSVSGGYANTYGYDSTGRLTSATGRTYTWTGLDRLASITVGPTLAAYSYDGEGRRVKSTVDGVSRYFVLDPSGKILAEYDGAGLLLIEHIYLGDKRIASRKASDGSRLYFQQDAAGSSWLITSGTGSPVQNFRYWPFGEVWDQFGSFDAPLVLIFQDGFESGNTSLWSCTVPGTCSVPDQFAEPLYTGKQLDEESGLFYFEARNLDPRIGRFTSPDRGPLLLENPQSFNRYALAYNSPFKYADPTGNHPVLIALGLYAAGLLTAEAANAPESIDTPLIQDQNSGLNGMAIAAAAGPLAERILGPIASFGRGLIGKTGREAIEGVTNDIPEMLARVIPGKGPFAKLSPGSDAFVTAADDIAGLDARGIARVLGIEESKSFTVIRFPSANQAVASPIRRSNPLFVGRGRTIGGAREFVVPNQAIPANATIEIVD